MGGDKRWGERAIYGFSKVLDNYDLFCGNRENEIRQKSHFEGRSNRIGDKLGLEILIHVQEHLASLCKGTAELPHRLVEMPCPKMEREEAEE